MSNRSVHGAWLVWKTVFLGVLLALGGLILITWPVLWGLVIGEAPKLNGDWALLTRPVGAAFLVSGMLGLFSQFMLRRSFAELVKEKVASTMDARYTALGKQRRAGLLDIYKDLPTHDFKEKVAERTRASEGGDIRILQAWPGNLYTIGDSLRGAAAAGVKVKVLLLDPNFPSKELSLASYRGQGMGHRQFERGRDDLMSALSHLVALRDRPEVEGNIELKIYSAMPAFSMHAVGNIRYVGFFWEGMSTLEGPQLEIGSLQSGEVPSQSGEEPFLKARIDKHFDTLWEKASAWQEEQPARNVSRQGS